MLEERQYDYSQHILIKIMHNAGTYQVMMHRAPMSTPALLSLAEICESTLSAINISLLNLLIHFFLHSPPTFYLSNVFTGSPTFF